MQNLTKISLSWTVRFLVLRGIAENKRKEYNIVNINQVVALVRADYSQINQTYLMTFLHSPQAIEMYGKMEKSGARDNLSLQNIADLQIPVAPLELQNQFAAFVEQTDKSKLTLQKSLDKLETLKKALMQKYFG